MKFFSLSWHAILVGVSIDTIGTRITSLVFTYSKALQHGLQNGPDIQGCMIQLSSDVFDVLIPLIIIGLLFDIFGGLVMGILSKGKILLQAVIAYTLVMFFSFVSSYLFLIQQSVPHISTPIWFTYVSYIASILSPILFITSAYFGRYMQKKKISFRFPFSINPLIFLLLIVFIIKSIFVAIPLIMFGFHFEYFSDLILLVIPLLLLMFKNRWGYAVTILSMILLITGTWQYLQNKEPLMLSTVFWVLLLLQLLILFLSIKECKRLFFTKKLKTTSAQSQMNNKTIKKWDFFRTALWGYSTVMMLVLTISSLISPSGSSHGSTPVTGILVFAPIITYIIMATIRFKQYSWKWWKVLMLIYSLLFAFIITIGLISNVTTAKTTSSNPIATALLFFFVFVFCLTNERDRLHI